MAWLHQHDLVVIGETKAAKLPHIPGFVPTLAKSTNSTRGGVALLVKSYLFPDVYNVDKSINDQLWFSLTSIPGVRFCGAYITPSSSPYFSEAEIAQLQARSTDENTNYVIVGDLNSRFGSKVCELTEHCEKDALQPC